jgi:hypothetical protein
VRVSDPVGAAPLETRDPNKRGALWAAGGSFFGGFGCGVLAIIPGAILGGLFAYLFFGTPLGKPGAEPWSTLVIDAFVCVVGVILGVFVGAVGGALLGSASGAYLGAKVKSSGSGGDLPPPENNRPEPLVERPESVRTAEGPASASAEPEREAIQDKPRNSLGLPQYPD